QAPGRAARASGAKRRPGGRAGGARSPGAFGERSREPGRPPPRPPPGGTAPDGGASRAGTIVRLVERGATSAPRSFDGGPDRMTTGPRVAVIGIDCATPQLLFDQLADEVPNIAALMQRGFHAGLASITPPITIPAWACAMSG